MYMKEKQKRKQSSAPSPKWYLNKSMPHSTGLVSTCTYRFENSALVHDARMLSHVKFQVSALYCVVHCHQ